MQDDPSRFWRDLTENYRRMSDGELLQLAARPEDLTDIAQQVLRDEMKLRGLDKPRPAPLPVRSSRTKPADGILERGFGEGYVPSAAEDADQEEEDEDQPSHEYTWKTVLCDCESNEHALQLRETLRRQGIESWVRSVFPYSTDLLGPQVLVAADELERAQAIAAQPIPQDVRDQWNTAIPEFELPHCPRCGSTEEVVLDSTDPVNTWLCESCGAEWTDPEDKPS